MKFIGTAGWSIPAQYKDGFPEHGSHLERYAKRFNGVEINSSFYRSHKYGTYQRWAASVPSTFRFSVKMPRSITQNHRLQNCEDLLDPFLQQVSGLGDKLGVVLVQLPPSLEYDADVAAYFFRNLARIRANIVCEPRHISWFTPAADQDLKELQVGRVAADPPRALTDGTPGGDRKIAYYRLHGSPKIYYSDYSRATLIDMAADLCDSDWCIFDNTAAFYATANALILADLCEDEPRPIQLR